jgi:hypothetical protein
MPLMPQISPMTHQTDQTIVQIDPESFLILSANLQVKLILSLIGLIIPLSLVNPLQTDQNEHPFLLDHQRLYKSVTSKPLYYFHRIIIKINPRLRSFSFC